MDKHTIRTYTGKEFQFTADIDPDTIDIRDIAHALSHLCRFTGHTNLFYSVAQHCLLVAEKIHGGPEVKLAALLHDAAEAYVGDLSSPLRDWMDGQDHECSWHRLLHDHILEAIYKKFGLDKIPEELGMYDQAVCRYEQEAFLGTVPVGIELWTPWNPMAYAASMLEGEFGQVEAGYLMRFEALMAACGREHLV